MRYNRGMSVPVLPLAVRVTEYQMVVWRGSCGTDDLPY